MKKAVLFTVQPEAYSHVLEEVSCICNIFTEITQLQRYLYEYQPSAILIDIDSIHYSQTKMLTNFDENTQYHPIVIFAECEELKRMLKNDFHQGNTHEEKEIPEDISKIFDIELLRLHFSPALRGYLYIKQALYFEYLHSQTISFVKKDIYETVSDYCNTSVSSVERGIRFSISKAYQKNEQEFQNIFHKLTKAPSNFTFLKTIFIHMKQTGLL